MGFPRSVREEALVAAARYCCVCHRYRGMKVEVHHIIPQCEGGSSTTDNAIALCFDCHTDAGHYNPRHPKGTKFSRSELRAARDRWYAIVREKGVDAAPLTTSPVLQSRYLVCKNIDLIGELLDQQLTHLPFGKSFLVTNDVFRQARENVVPPLPHMRRRSLRGDVFKTGEDYLGAHPDAEILRKSPAGDFPYFNAMREVHRKEIRTRMAPEDGVTARLLETTLSPSQIGRALAYYDACGEGAVQEIYLLRPLWMVLFSVTNLGETPVALLEIEGRTIEGSARDVGFLNRLEQSPLNTVPLPRASILPGESVVVPVAMLLPDFSVEGVELYWASEESLDIGCSQTLVKASFAAAETESFQLWGTSFDPHRVSFKAGDDTDWAKVHNFDPTNLYTVDRSWAIGSCPHAFLIRSTGVEYLRELFATAPRKIQKEVLSIPPGALGIEIAELEDEISYVWESQPPSSPHLLRKGERLFLKRPADGELELWGSYHPLDDIALNLSDPIERNRLIRGSLSEHPLNHSPSESVMR